MKRVFVIVVTYNGMQWIDKCLSSLENSLIPVDIIVIDNHSFDQTCQYIEENYPAVRLIKSEKNLGFGQANNIGMSMAMEEKAELVFLLNQDAWIAPDTIKLLCKSLELHSEFGIMSPYHFNGNGTATDTNFKSYIDRYSREYSEGIYETSFVNAAAWMLTADCIRKTGEFDPIFFHYGEDWNYAQRVIYNNYKIGICTDAVIWHDRVQDVKAELSKQQKTDRIFTQFLVYACDVNRDGWIRFCTRRIARHMVASFQAIITGRKEDYYINLNLAKKIALKLPQIRRSRKLSINH
ncbi:glycosyltransferase family 2 protein [Flavihumibacter sp. ZG627]|uniref:glycosyltransferase family 2 protein n=1 Tax=Flavihumibacter sp. ZG627 TaxID=1463156 RepID=UPI00057EBB60|nr:glycosyltransferase [Flavihumibacter sp. ZG627]KIC92316.1 hypothetical protein HY58_01905 [Flavihumibacter sp. ZG627]